MKKQGKLPKSGNKKQSRHRTVGAKRLLSLALSICMALAVMPAMSITASAAATWDGTIPLPNASYAFSGGDGTGATPYLISTAADLAQLAVNINAGTNYTNKIFVQTADIDLNNGVAFTFEAGTGLVTVSNGTNTFYLGTGVAGDDSDANTVFDTTASTAGTIYSSNSATAVGVDTIGLHSWTPIGTSAKPFMGYFRGQGYAIRGIYINKNSNYQGLFGYAQGSIRNAGVANSYIRGSQYVGGIAGYAAAGNTNCYNTGTICGYSNVGGITGYSNSSYNCYNAGTVNGTSNVGGVAGVSKGQFQYCYSTNTVSGTNNVGSVLGFNEFGYVLYCGTIGTSQQVTAGTAAQCGGAGAQTLLTGLTSGTSTLLEALNAWVINENQIYNYTWKSAGGSTNGGYPILDAEYVALAIPAKPTNLAAIPGDGSISLTWTAPSNTGGSSITNYEISVDDGINWSPTNSTATTFTIQSLKNGDSYTIKVRAINAQGAGALSDAITATLGTYTIATISNQTMIGLTAGYGSGIQEIKTLIIEKTGTNDLANLVTTLGGSNPSSFTITQPIPTTLNSVTTQAAFTVKAKDGLATGTYTATVIVSADSMTNQTFTVTQVVNAVGGGNSSGGGGSSTPTTITKIESGENVTSANLGKLVAEKKSLTVEGKVGEKLLFDTEALKNIDGQTKGSVKVEIKDVSADYKNEHPDRLVVSLTVTAGGKHITSFGNGIATVSLPYELKEGEKAEDVTVWYLAEDGTMSEVPCSYDPVTKLATFKVNHFSLYVVGTADTSKWINPFSDVKESSWFYDAVRYVSANGLMQGTKDKTFNPDGKTSRGMIVTILWRMENQPKTEKEITFTDVKNGKYYHDAVAWASEKGIVVGYSADKFGPEDSITREQLAVILHNYAASKGYTTGVSAGPTGELPANLSAFSDAGKIHKWGKDAMSWANAEGLINGTGSDLLDPAGTAQRSQVAAILQRFAENTAKIIFVESTLK